MAVVRIFLVVALVTFAEGASVAGKSDVYDTIVIGMGSAGITAASELAAGGRRVLALEAQDRIGGRVNTVPCGGDGVLELGAEWIHGTEGSPTYKLALDNNITILANDIDSETMWSDGRPADQQLIRELVTVVLEAPFDPPEDPEPTGHHVTKRILAYIGKHHPQLLNDTEFITEFLAFADLVVDSYDASDSWNDSSTHGTYTQLGGNQDMSWHKNGYKTLFQILLNTYKDGPGLPTLTVKLNTEVTKILWAQEPSGKVIVKTKDGVEYTADNVIVTVSIGVLKERYTTLFDPQLPPKKVASFDSITLGVVDKIVLFFSESWWPQDTWVSFLWRAEDKRAVPEEDRWTTRISGGSPPMGCDKALTLWTHGEAARYIEKLSEEKVKEKSMELLRRFLGGKYNITEATGIIRTTWYSNPFTRGSYSFDNLLAPQHPSARDDLAEPLVDSSGHPRVLFAGEATSRLYHSTVHGAVATGRREAARLLGSRPSLASSDSVQ